MAKNIVSVGGQVPGGDVEDVSLWSDRSLLDADIVLFSPGIPRTANESTYVGKRCLSDDASFMAKRAMAHWKRELLFAADAGNLIVVFLAQPESVYVATGDKTWSGTGRNARATRMVEELSPYECRGGA